MGIVPPARPNIPANWQDSPENVGRLPREIVGDFSSLKSLGGAYRLPVAGTLPGGLPGNFNNIKPELDIPYGSVGFSLVCRSVSDFTKILAIIRDYVSMGYTHELSGEGAGSITLDRDDPLLLEQLVNTDDVEDILSKDNLWEVYFDGKRRFQWLAQNVSEPMLTDSERRTISLSGNGIASYLEWGLVLPNRLGASKEKIENVAEDFAGQDVETYSRWVDNAGTVAALSGKAGITAAAADGLGSYISTAIDYDFTDSGVQARVQPYIAPDGPGYLRTFLSVENGSSNYVQIYVTRDPVDVIGEVLMAEVNGPGGLLQVKIDYNPTTQAYWRIQELDSKAIFSYRAENSTEADWVTFATLDYSFPASPVRLRLRVSAVGGANLTLPKTSYFSEVNMTGVGSAVPPLEKFRRLLLKAQARGALTYVIPNWTPQADSMGAAWVGSPTVDATIGANLLEVLKDYCVAQNADWFMDADFRLHIRQRVWSESGSDPTAPFHKEDKVIFFEADSQDSKERRRAYSDVRNYVLGATDNGEYVVKSDPASIAKYQQREVLMSDSLRTQDTPSLETVLSNQLTTSKEGVVSWTLTVPYNREGKRLYEDYTLGDWVSVQSVDPYRKDVWRIAAIAVQVDSNGHPEVELTLNEKLTPYWHKLQEKIRRVDIRATSFRPPRKTSADAWGRPSSV